MTNSPIAAPIPKWVTIYGFSILVVLVCLLLMFSFFFKVERAVQVQVYFTGDSTFVKLTTDEFSLVKDIDVSKIRISKSEMLSVKFDTKNMRVINNNIHIPIRVLDGGVRMKLENSASKYDAQVVIDRSSLLSKVVSQ